MRRLLIGFALTALAAFGADVSGTWNFEVDTDAGSGSPTFVLKQNGEVLTGTYSGALGEANISGTVKGEDVLIEFTPDGAGDGKAKVRYTGKLDSSAQKMKGEVDLAGMAKGTFTAAKKK